MQNVTTDNLLLTIPETASLLRLGRTKVYELISSGEGFPVVRFGRSVRIPSEQLKEWVQRQVQNGNAVE